MPQAARACNDFKGKMFSDGVLLYDDKAPYGEFKYLQWDGEANVRGGGPLQIAQILAGHNDRPGCGLTA
jgi:hypothetical protein